MKYILYLILIIIAIVLIKENIEIIILLGIVSLIVYFIFFNKKKDKEIEYDPNDDFLELYDSMGFKEDITRNLDYPHLAEIREYQDFKMYRFFLNNNKVDRFEKGIELIEQLLQERVIEIERDKKDYRILNIKTTERELKYEKEFKEIGLKTKGGKVPLFIEKEERTNILKRKYCILRFRTLLKVGDFEAKKEELKKILCNENEDILKIDEKGQVTNIYIGKQQQSKIDWKEEYNSKDTIFCIGFDNLLTKLIKINLDDKHLLMAGGSGSGKSTLLRLFLWLMHLKGWILYMADFKDGAEFNFRCRKLGKVVTTRREFLNLLIDLDKEATKRNKIFSSAGVTNFKEYNQIADVKFKRVGFLIDELASPLDERGADKETKLVIKQIEFYLSELARKARNAGMHMICCMQRPDANVLEGQIKNNLMVRICGRFVDKEPSKIVLDNYMATTLPLDINDDVIKGRMILKDGGFKEIQAFYFELNSELKNLENKEDLEDEKTKKETVKEMDHKEEESKNLENEKLKTAKESEEMKNNIKGLFDDL